MSAFYVTSYCNHAHRVSDGKPIAHECHILPAAALKAEMADNIPLACELIQQAKIASGFSAWGCPTLSRHKGIR